MTQANVDDKPTGKPEPDAVLKAFTQEEVNAMMGRVRAEERGKFPDYARLKERAGVADTLEKSNLTEKEKSDRAAAEWQRKAVDAEARVADTAIRADIRVQAVQLGIVDPDAAVALIDRSGIGYSDEEGVRGVADALTALVAAKPYLKGAAPAKPVAPNLNGKDGKAPGAAPQLTPEQRNVAHRMYSELGHTEAEIKYSKGIPVKA